jgi:putative transposase
MLRAERGLACRGCEDNAAGRKRYLEYLEGRVRAEGAQAGRTLPADQSLQSTLRRGWFFGSEAFREKVLGLAQATLRLRSRSADFGGTPEVREHRQADAEVLVQRGLSMFTLEEADLLRLPRGDERKALIGLAVKDSTTVALDWIARRLAMGTRSTVSRELGCLSRRMKMEKDLEQRYRQLIER